MSTIDILVPDIGNATNVDVIEILVAVGDAISPDQSLITLEGDKATIDIPSPHAGMVREIRLKVGDKVSKNSVILTLETTIVDDIPVTTSSILTASTVPPAEQAAVLPVTVSTGEVVPDTVTSDDVHAGPGVRRLARELGVDLARIQGTGAKQRILKEDLHAYVKDALNSGVKGGMGLPQAPVVDFSQFGEITVTPLSRIKKISATNLHRNWLLVPHVTQFDEADITEMEAFRKAQLKQAEQKGIKLTPLAFVMKAAVAALKAFPSFNASLDPTGEQLILKQYFHMGVAVDTPDGLVVPVIRNVDQKGILTLAAELGTLSQKARDKGLTPGDMQGSSFTISSLGGIGGTAFTPIVNLPDVAILGVSRASLKPVYENNQFVPRLMLPLSVSYDHRVIDGAQGARFTAYLAQCLSDLKLSLL